MGAVWAAAVEVAESFRRDVETLRPKYAEIDAAIELLTDALRLGGLPDIPVDAGTPRVYGIAADYPAKGSAGRGVFLVTYHATDPVPPNMRKPFRTFTLLTITERHPAA